MPRTGKRRKVARHIYADANGVSGVVTVRGHSDELRFASGTPLVEIRRALEKRRRVLEDQHPAIVRGSAAHVIARYLRTLPKGPIRKDRLWLLKPWSLALGATNFGAVSRGELTQVLEAWRHAGLSASRANKRISALRVAWRAIARDDSVPHPIERLRRFREPPAAVRGVPMELLELVTAAMPASASRARVRVLQWTGQPPALVMKMQPQHVRWLTDPPELYVSPRRKGAGSADAWIPLVPSAVAALREFFKCKASGTFQTSALARSFKRGVKAAQRELRKQKRHDDVARLNGIRLYDLRHSFATWFAQNTRDQWALAEYLRHAKLSTTDRYMRGASSARTRQAVLELRQQAPRRKAI
jgi:site-specific recombinase XerC